MKTFYIDIEEGAEVLGVVTRATSMEDALLQVRAFNHGRVKKAQVERISCRPTRGVKYEEWN